MKENEMAQDLFNEFYMILFDSDSDKGEECIVSLLAKKCAEKAVTRIMSANPHSNPLNNENVESTFNFWQGVKNEIQKL